MSNLFAIILKKVIHIYFAKVGTIPVQGFRKSLYIKHLQNRQPAP